MKTKLYVAYGSNLNKSQMSHRCPKARVVETGFVNDFRLTFRGSGVANIEFSKGSKVPVAVWEITSECERALDSYEGYPNLYIKREVDVETDNGIITAMVYVMTPKYEEYPKLPYEFYYNVIKAGYMDNKLPTEYLSEAAQICRKEVLYNG